MGDHSVDRLIDALNGLKEESEKLIDKYNIWAWEKRKYMILTMKIQTMMDKRTIFEEPAEKIYGTEVEKLQPIMEGKSYMSVSK